MTTARDDLGNVQVEFVWGNLPMQPNDDRGENILDPELDSHIIATSGWGGYPGFEPNSSGAPAGTLASDLITFYAAALATETIGAGNGMFVETPDNTHPYLVINSDQNGGNNTYYYSDSGTLYLFPPANDLSLWTQDSPTTWHQPGMGSTLTMELLPTGGWEYGTNTNGSISFQRLWQVVPATGLVVPFTV